MIQNTQQMTEQEAFSAAVVQMVILGFATYVLSQWLCKFDQTQIKWTSLWSLYGPKIVYDDDRDESKAKTPKANPKRMPKKFVENKPKTSPPAEAKTKKQTPPKQMQPKQTQPKAEKADVAPATNADPSFAATFDFESVLSTKESKARRKAAAMENQRVTQEAMTEQQRAAAEHAEAVRLVRDEERQEGMRLAWQQEQERQLALFIAALSQRVLLMFFMMLDIYVDVMPEEQPSSSSSSSSASGSHSDARVPQERRDAVIEEALPRALKEKRSEQEVAPSPEAGPRVIPPRVFKESSAQVAPQRRWGKREMQPQVEEEDDSEVSEDYVMQPFDPEASENMVWVDDDPTPQYQGCQSWVPGLEHTWDADTHSVDFYNQHGYADLTSLLHAHMSPFFYPEQQMCGGCNDTSSTSNLSNRLPMKVPLRAESLPFVPAAVREELEQQRVELGIN